jgi:hypothetical protein
MKKSHKKGRRSKRQNKTRKGGMYKKEQETHEKKYISDIEAVNKMIYCTGATLEVISIDSLYGFVFLLTIPQDQPDCIQFIGLDGKPIYQIILKVALCYMEKPNHSSYRGVIGDIEYTKSAMNWNDFYFEANAQHQIFTAFPSNPVTFGVGSCHLYYRVDNTDQFIYNEDITYDKLGETTNTLLDNLYKIASAKPLENQNKRAKTEPQETITQETINYIKNILTGHNDYHFAFIAMDAAMNHIDRNKYDILTLRNVRRTRYYPRCMEYANAIMILLFIKLNVLNIDAHSGNFLSSVKKEGSIDDNVKSWMIDMGRIYRFSSSVCEHMYNNPYDRKNKLNGHSLRDIYYSRFDRFCDYDYAFIMWIVSEWKSNKQVINDANITNILHFINTFLIMMDYSINLIKYNRDSGKPPQSIRFADHITENIDGDIDSMTTMVNILNDYLPKYDVSPSIFYSQETIYEKALNNNMKTVVTSLEKYKNIYSYMKIIDPTIYHHVIVSDDTNVVNMNVDEDDNKTLGKRTYTNNDDEPFSNPFYNKEHEPLENITPLNIVNISSQKKPSPKKVTKSSKK